uniref:Uncharacterized protein n=1 Tax=Fusarium oxysporum (strain Fo5176) TaxID=660025 RepID=A0A0D2YH04_FUSOF
MGIEEQFVLLSLGLATIGVRIGLRTHLFVDGPCWFISDEPKSTNTKCVVLGSIVFIAQTVAADLVVAKFQGLTNSYMTNEERANIDIHGQEHYNRVWGSKIQVMGWSLYACILWSLKVCVTAFYGRLTYLLPSCRKLVVVV